MSGAVLAAAAAAAEGHLVTARANLISDPQLAQAAALLCVGELLAGMVADQLGGTQDQGDPEACVHCGASSRDWRPRHRPAV